MEIQTIYSIIQSRGQGSPREYIDVRSKSQKMLFVKPKHKTSYLEDIMKSATIVPGPGKYNVSTQSKEYKKVRPKKIDFAQESKKPGTSFLDKLLKEKQKVPGVGKYNPQVDHREQIRIKYQALGDRIRKDAPLFKSTIFDDNQRDMINVGPGLYQPYQPFGEKKSFRIPDQFGKKEEEIPTGKDQEDDKKVKKAQSMTKLPSVHSYTPIHQNYETFDGMASKSSSRQANYHTFTSSQRKLSIQQGPGPKYNLIAQWSPRNNKTGKNIFKSVSTQRQAGVYH